MPNLWFKFYGGEYLSDPKIERLSPLERSCWLTILCMASMGNNGIVEFLTVESLLNRSGIQFNPYHPEEWESALSVLVKFKKLNMINMEEDGQIVVKNWEKRQEHNLTIAERVAKSRAKKKIVTTDVTNVTTEENRIEERIHTAEHSSPESEFNIKDEIQKMMQNPRRELRIIGWFINEKKISLKNKEQLSTTIRRHLRAAKLLVSFEVPQLKTAADNADRLVGTKWTLETLWKLLTK